MTEHNFIGLKILQIRPMTDEEREKEGWENQTSVIILSDGSKLYPSRDSEGNDAGSLFATLPDGKQIGFR